MFKNKYSLIILCFIVIALAIGLNLLYQRTKTIELVIATGSSQGEYYAMGKAIAQVLPRYVPNIKVRVMETKGATENIALVDKGDAHLGFAQIDSDTKPDTRSIASMYVEAFHLVVRPGSNIKEFADIRGKRIIIPPQGSGAYNSFTRLLRYYDIKETDFRTSDVMEANQALRTGKVDGIFRIVGAGNRNMRNLIQESGGILVPIDQASAIQIFYPQTEPIVIPKGTYSAFPPVPPADLPTVGVRSLLITNRKIDNELIRKITAVLFDYRNDLVNLNPRAATITYPGSEQTLGLPIHAGAKAFYDRDKPSFLQENAEPIALIITIATIVISFIAQLRSQVADRQKNRADFYNLELVQLIEEAERATDLEELEALRKRLLNIFRQVIEDLDKDRLSPESYQLFVFPWEVAITSLRHRESLLLKK